MPRIVHSGNIWGHLRLGLYAGLAIAILTSIVYWVGWFERTELRAFDMRFVARFLWDDATIEHGPLVVVAIDERSLEAVGRWPWPWREQARLIRAITEAGAGAVGLNILYAESDGDMEGVAQLADAIAQNGRVVLAAASRQAQDVLPVQPLAARAAGIGSIDVMTDRDGVIRRLETGRAASRPEPFAVALLRVAGAPINQDLVQETFFVNYRPPADDTHLRVNRLVETVSAIDVMDGIVGGSLRGKIVLVGTTARGVQDMHNTPLMAAVPGVYIHAFAARSLLLDDYLSKVSPRLTLLLIWGVALLGSAVAFVVRPWFLATLATVTTLVAIGIALSLFFNSGLWFEVTPLLATGAIAFVAGLAYAHSVVDRDTRRVRSLFRRYVAPEVVDRLLQDAGSVEVGRRAVVTVLFADIRQFTAFAESVTPEEAVQTLDRYLQAMAESVLTHGGTLDKYIGDAVMAIFGAPLAREDHAQAAIQTALEIRRNIKALSEELGHAGGQLQVGIGIHSGEAVVGSIGSMRRREYTAIGDVVNVASRLEESAKPGEILISAAALKAWGQPAPSPRIDLAIRGRKDVISLYRIADSHDDDVLVGPTF